MKFCEKNVLCEKGDEITDLTVEGFGKWGNYLLITNEAGQ